jgi:aryl-alcohol dehydrogenase-like predicted oxidoreductase
VFECLRLIAILPLYRAVSGTTSALITGGGFALPVSASDFGPYVLDYCERRSIGFIPWFPLAAGSLAKSGAAPSQIALAWVLKRSPIMLPIPGTSKVAHLEENVAAVDIQLSVEEFAALDRAGRKERAS